MLHKINSEEFNILVEALVRLYGLLSLVLIKTIHRSTPFIDTIRNDQVWGTCPL